VIWLARHGQTAYNHERRFQGHLPVPLNDTGRAQAKLLAQAAAQLQWATLVCSPLARTVETATIVGQAIGLEPVLDARFAETDCGDWTDLTFDEVIAADPDGFAGFATGRVGFRFPGGESFEEQERRALDGLADVRAGAQPALIVSHGGTMRLILAHERSDPSLRSSPLPNAELVELGP
jgi:broad specificity phosphatase PhoE